MESLLAPEPNSTLSTNSSRAYRLLPHPPPTTSTNPTFEQRPPVEHDRSVQYVTATDTNGADRRRHRTTLAGKSGVNAAIKWDEELFEIAGRKRAISVLKRRTSSFSSSRYWTLSLLKEFKVRYEHGVWTVASSNGIEIAWMTPRVAHVFRTSTPAVLLLAPGLRDEHARRFIILVLLYSETWRMDVANS